MRKLVLLLVILSTTLVGSSARFGIHTQAFHVQMNIDDATANEGLNRNFTPCHGTDSGFAIAGIGNEIRCRVVRDTWITRFSVAMHTNMTSSNEKCDFVLVTRGTVRTWTTTEVGDGILPTTCSAIYIKDDADLDKNQESCTQVNPNGAFIPAGGYFLIRKLGSSPNCGSIVGVQVTLGGFQL